MTGISLSNLKGVGPSTVKKLNNAKIFTVEDLGRITPDDLSKIEGVGFRSAVKWISEAKLLLSKGQKQTFNQEISLESSIERSDDSFKQLQIDI